MPPAATIADEQSVHGTESHEANAARRFCLGTIGLSAAMFAAIAITNFLVNPYAQYPTTFFTPLVQTSRAQKTQLLIDQAARPEGLVLGSSRVLKFEPDYLQSKTGLAFFNAGVNYGKTEDYLAIFRFYREHFRASPKVIVVGVDVNAFSNDSPFDARLLGNAELAKQIRNETKFSDRFHRWRELLSWNQTKSSAKTLKMAVKTESPPEPVESFRHDGLIVYHQREKELAAGTYDFAGALQYNQNEYTQLFGNYSQLSTKRQQIFETLIAECHTARTRVIVFTAPMHPGLVAHLGTKSNFQDRKTEVIEYLQQQSANGRFEFHDFTEIKNFGGNEKLFVDGIHPLEQNTQQMIDQLLGQNTSN